MRFDRCERNVAEPLSEADWPHGPCRSRR